MKTRWQLTIEDAGGYPVNPYVRLRHALKRMLRGLGFRVTDMRIIEANSDDATTGKADALPGKPEAQAHA